MTHQPQQILIKVMCSERLPSDSGWIPTTDGVLYFGRKTSKWYEHDDRCVYPSHWYEPATRIVLTEEELQDLLSDARSEGYNNASMDAGSRY